MKNQFQNAARRARLFTLAGCTLFNAKVDPGVAQDFADYLQNSKQAEVLDVQADGTVDFVTGFRFMTPRYRELTAGWNQLNKGSCSVGSCAQPSRAPLENVANWLARTFNKNERALQAEVKATAAKLKA